MTNKVIFTKLPNRSKIIINGSDRYDFLQGLITQDIHLLKSGDSSLIYSCLLTPNGKFLFDFFITQDNESIIIDCEGGDRADQLFKKLSMFKLRSDVSLNLVQDIDVWQIFMGNIDNSLTDPRHSSCGYRSYIKPNIGEHVDFNIWDKHRITNEIPDGSRDLIPEKSFIHESIIVTQTAVSYTKGCYMGQELVSRMHHRGLAKKILKCVQIDNETDETTLRSQCDNVGLALVKVA